MANILSDSANWEQTDSLAQPPSWWTGSTYDYIGNSGTGLYYDGAVMRYQGTVNTGDVVSGSIHSTSADATSFGITVNGSSVASESLTTGQTYPFSFTLNASDAVVISLGAGDFLYSQDAVLTPTAPTLVALDESITVLKNSFNNPAPSQVNQDGTTVDAALAIASNGTNGVANVLANVLVYTPNTSFVGNDSFTYTGSFDGATSNAATVSVIVTVPLPCEELGRVTRSFVSGYESSRVETRRIRRFSKRCVVADFTAAMVSGHSITHVRWDTTSPWSILMSNPRVETSGTKVAVDVIFNFAGWGGIKATATWDNGEITNTEFFFTVVDRPLYPGANYNDANGPYTLEANS